MDDMRNFAPVDRLAYSHWKSRAIVATHGNQSFTGCLLLAILGRASENPPRVVSGGEIDGSGGVWAVWQGRGEHPGRARLRKLCDIKEYTDRFRYLDEHLKLTDQERQEMWFEIKAWITTDHRPRKEWDHERQQHA